MSIQKDTFQKLDLCNSFLFAAALEQPKICQLVLEIILGQKAPGVKVHAEHSVLVSSDFARVARKIECLHEDLTSTATTRETCFACFSSCGVCGSMCMQAMNYRSGIMWRHRMRTREICPSGAGIIRQRWMCHR